MNKYCIYDKNGDYEVWKYIDDIDEARQYWYIGSYLNKYGEQEMPICMNKSGGFHSCQKEYVKCIIEAEEFPSLSSHYDLLESRIVNTPDFNCGWIDTLGNTYKNDTYDHLPMAQDLVLMNYKQEWSKYYLAKNCLNMPDQFLLDKGWVKVDKSHPHFIYDIEKLTNETAKTMQSLQEK